MISSHISVLWACDLRGEADKANKYDFLFRETIVPSSMLRRYFVG